MTDAVFTVVRAGPHVTYQNGGRPGMLRFGVPASGAMDRLALAAANLAVGNPAGATVIEISAGGLVLDCVAGEVGFAVAGGGFAVTSGKEQFGSWSVARIAAGMRLTIRPGPWGSWTCLAFAGTVDAPTWLGSKSTHGPSGLGGGKLTTGAKVRVTGTRVPSESLSTIPCPVFARPRHEVRVVLGPQERFFDEETIHAFLGQAFVLTDSYDRMGVRLAGPSLKPAAVLDMPSEPILRGSVQVAGDGVASVLMADHGTTGGYPKIATILDEDLDGFARLRSRNRVGFRAVTPEEAISIRRSGDAARRAYLAGVAARGIALFGQ
ncbi:MAG: biotin-dependent carboxyltransferase family protein [Rhodobacterales bacterium]|nr:biotin-dependent carboxyltransferase family protein [Rhodobacterales bacterium]